jgi:hypothetical protein
VRTNERHAQASAAACDTNAARANPVCTCGRGLAHPRFERRNARVIARAVAASMRILSMRCRLGELAGATT